MAASNSLRIANVTRDSQLATAELREEALERLYRRKTLLDQVINSLEDYQSHSASRGFQLVPGRAGAMRWSELVQ